MIYSHLQEVQHHLFRERNDQRELHPKGTGKIQMRLLHHYVISGVVCPLKLEALLKYFSRMLQPCVNVCRLAGRACRHQHRNVLWHVWRSI